MDALRFGRQFRALRVRSGLRQQDVADRAELSRSLIASIDRGNLDGVTVGAISRASAALGADVDLWLRWRGERLDRLLDEDHAAVVERVVSMLRAAGWSTAVEVSFSIWGERGSIDVLAVHPTSRSLLVVEVKSVVPDSQEMLHRLDQKARLAPRVAAERGWEPSQVSRVLVVRDSSTARGRIARLSATYDAALPTRGRAVRAWIRRPGGPIGGLLFLPDDSHASTVRRSAGRDRVNRPRLRSGRRTPAPDDSHAGI